MNGATYARDPLAGPSIRIAALADIALVAACSGQKKAEQLSAATESVIRLQEGVVDFATHQQRWPTKMEELKVSGDPMPGVSYAAGEGGVIAVYFTEDSALSGARLVYTPSQSADGNVTWACTSEGLEAELKPADCS